MFKWFRFWFGFNSRPVSNVIVSGPNRFNDFVGMKKPNRARSTIVCVEMLLREIFIVISEKVINLIVTKKMLTYILTIL